MTAFETLKKFIKTLKKERADYLLIYFKKQNDRLSGHYYFNMDNVADTAHILVESAKANESVALLIETIIDLQKEDNAKADQN